MFKLKAKGVDGEALWAYRYRLAVRGSPRLQAGGFATRAEAQKALQNKLARLGPGERALRITLTEWVEEYLQTHTGERVTIAKLRWLLGKATAAPVRCGLPTCRRRRMSVADSGARGHRYEAPRRFGRS